MTADPYMERVQRRVLDLAAEVSWRDARLAEVEAAAPKMRDFTLLIDANGDEWTWTRHGLRLNQPVTPLPTTEQYADAERLLQDWCCSSDPLGPRALAAARLRCWIADTKPLPVKAGWNDEPVSLDWQDIVDRVAADLPSPCPSLWQRTPEWAFGVAALVLTAAMFVVGLVLR